MSVIIVSDDAFFLLGAEAILQTKLNIDIHCVSAQDISSVTVFSNVAACIISVENDRIREEALTRFSKTTENIYFFFDSNIGNVASYCLDKWIISKKISTDEFSTIIKSARRNITSGITSGQLSPTLRDSIILDMFISGLEISSIAHQLGITEKTAYGRKYKMMMNKGIIKHNAYGLMLLRKIIDCKIHLHAIRHESSALKGNTLLLCDA